MRPSAIGILAASAADTQPAAAPRFCVVPVRDGVPTEKDIGQAWRMITKGVMLPGVPRPAIYALNRNEMIVVGANALHLLLDTRFSGAAACGTPESRG